ncbi:MAG: hypothetical protein E6R03_08375 [Hyphomicrobiaceae bacterium]|nr:MAG: hypothetical protein E6R03_08375 [Hyphomicrobiaceae bacterium]
MATLKEQLFVQGLKGQMREARLHLDNWLLHEPTENSRVEVGQLLLDLLDDYLLLARRGAEEPFLHEASDFVGRARGRVY